MTREQAKAMLPIMKAFAEGKTLQYRVNNKNNEWEDINNPAFNDLPSEYRIKPEPKYRPFKSRDECWNEMLKHQPFGWINGKHKYEHIVCVYESSIECSPDIDYYDVLHSCIITFNNALEHGYTFTDGTPFGIKEE